MRFIGALLLGCITTGCLGPLVEDDRADAGGDTLLLAAGTEVPSLHDDPELDQQVEQHDGVEGTVPRIGAFVGGEHVRYWDFGPAPAFVAPVWVFGTDDGAGGLAKLPDHPVLFDVVPGDPGYTPIWEVFAVFVTDSYAGELITSPAAIDEAVQRGLVEQPVQVPMYVNCPVVDPEVRLDVGGGEDPLEPVTCYYRGLLCYYFDLTPAIVAAEHLTDYPVQNRYVLRRAGGEPLSEPVRNVDMTGDGDLLDTNDLYDHGTDSPSYSPLVRTVEVAIPADAGSIDTYLDEAQTDYDDATELFEGSGEAIVPLPDVVVAYEVGDEIRNMPIQQAEGSN